MDEHPDIAEARRVGALATLIQQRRLDLGGGAVPLSLDRTIARAEAEGATPLSKSQFGNLTKKRLEQSPARTTREFLVVALTVPMSTVNRAIAADLDLVVDELDDDVALIADRLQAAGPAERQQVRGIVETLLGQPATVSRLPVGPRSQPVRQKPERAAARRTDEKPK